MFKTISIVVLGLLVSAFSVYAIEVPTLISPANNSTVSSIPTFTWQAVTGATGYNILIDDEPTVTSPYAKTPYYPTNPSYSPQTLNPGTYYWKVKAKDSSGEYGNFSSVWSFNLVASTSSPTPTSSPTQAPTSAPSTSTPTPSTASSISSSDFSISGVPSQINSDQTFSVSIDLSLPNSPNTNFYLKGAFKKADSSNYFGLTKVSGSWIKNGSSYSSQFPITTDFSGNWTNNLDIQPDSEDSGFSGTGDYIFKVGRYTQSGSGPTWSNEVTIKIIGASSDNQTNNTSSTSNDSGSPTNTTVSPPTSKSTSKDKTASKAKTKNYDTIVYHSASVAGETISSTSSASPLATPSTQVKQQKFFNLNIWTILGSVFILAGIGSIGFVYLRKKKNDKDHHSF